MVDQWVTLRDRRRSPTGGLLVDPALAAFVADELLAGVDLTPEWFWSTVADLHERFAPRAVELLARRDELQAHLDAWHREHGAPGEDALDDYVAFLTEIGYLLPEEEPRIAVVGGGPGDRGGAGAAARRAGDGPAVRAQRRQRPLGVAVRRALRHRRPAAGPRARPRLRRAARCPGDRARPDRLLDEYFPLEGARARRRHRLPASTAGRWPRTTADGAVGARRPAQFAGYRGDPGAREAVLLRRHTGCTSS